MSVTIRPAQPTDSERTVEIWRAAVDATHDFLSPEDRAAIEVEVRDFLPQAPLWVAVDAQDRAHGFMLLDGAHMEALFVDPEHHGTGVGRALVDHALTMHPAITTSVNEANAQAVAFYERTGFAATGRSELDGQGRAYPLIHMMLGER